MRGRFPTGVVALLVSATVACGIGTPSTGARPSEGGLSAEALSPASVGLAWPAVDGASGYSLSVRYGPADFLPVADLPADQLSFTHFVVPGAAQVAYRLSATIADVDGEVGSLDVSLPEFAPNPLVAEPLAFAPELAMPALPALPTIDPANPDLDALATAMAEMTNSILDPATSPQPTFVQQEIGPEGGEVTLTDPNDVIYTLTLPADAVREPTTITLTPIDSLRESPFTSDLLAGVQITPPIPFARPLRLTIALPPGAQAAGGAAVTGLVVSSLSGELSLAPAFERDRAVHTMDVHWGDTFGLAAATLGEIEIQAARIPSDWRAQMAQQLAALRAADPDRGPGGDARIAAQVLQVLVSHVESVSVLPSTAGKGGMAAPAVQGGSAAGLFRSIFWSEMIWDWLNQMLPPGANPPPGSELARSMSDWKTQIVSELTGAIKAYMDEHDGCRTGLALYAEVLRQILRSPGTPFQQALAAEYRARYGPPPDLQCEFRFQVVRSSIREFQPSDDYLGDGTETYAVHSEPWTLEMAIREGRLFLQGPIGVQYDAWEVTHSRCPPTVPLRPFPSSLVWITDLELVFDDDDRVSDLVLQGVSVDQRGTNIDSQVSTDQPEPNQCRLLSETAGTNPVDVWGMSFAGLHNPFRHLDNWVIEGEDSYTATDTIAGRAESQGDGQLTEDTTIVLTVNQK
jgi:hypothetical protein